MATPLSLPDNEVLRAEDAPGLKPFVEVLWHRRGYSPLSSAEIVLPTGTVEVVINLRGEKIGVSGGLRPLTFETFDGAVVCGPHCEPFIIDTSRPADLLGVHFAPGGAFPVLGVPLDQIRNRRVSLRDLWGAAGDELLYRVYSAPTAAESARALESFLADRLEAARSIEPAVAAALGALNAGVRNIGQIKSWIGLSPRHFERLFRAQVGLSPKRLARVLRFQSLLSTLEPAPFIDWAALAVEGGYSDQAHLIKEFREFTGVTPKSYMSVMNDHRNHLAYEQ